MHTATAEMSEPNSYFLDVTDFIGSRSCPQEDSSTPFNSLMSCHHSLKFTSEADLRDWVRNMCQTGPLFHPVDWDEMRQYVAAIVGAGSLSAEWIVAKGKLSDKYNDAPQRRKKNFAFWTEASLLP